MTFGLTNLTNAPKTFMDLTNRVFKKYLNIFMIMFIDDILIYSQNEDEHVEHLGIVKLNLNNSEFYSMFRKCEFWSRYVVFLGHIISSKGIQVDPKKN